MVKTVQISAQAESHKIHPGDNDVCQDDRTLAEKQKVLQKQHAAAKYTSIAETFQFLGGLLLTVGMSLVVNTLKEASTKGISMAAALGGETAGLALVGAAVASAAIAITSKYIGAKHAAGAYFDQTLVNAHQTARSLERKQLRVVEQEYEQNQRADGKSWVSVTRPNMAAAAIEQQQAQPVQTASVGY